MKMMYSAVGMLACLGLLVSPSNASPGWSTATPMPTARRGAVGGILKNKLVVAGGNNPQVPAAGHTVEIYDPLSEAWTTGPPLTEGRSDAASAPMNNQLFVAGGMGSHGGNISSVEYLDFNQQHEPDWGWKKAAPLPHALRGFSMAPLVDDNGNQYLYATGGMNCLTDCYSVPVEYTNRLNIYDVQHDTWAPGPSMHVGRRDHGSVVMNGKLYVVGGCGGDGSHLSYRDCTPLASIEMYDPATQVWTMLPPMPSPRHGGLVSFFDTDIIVLAGSSHAGIDAKDADKGLTSTVLWFDTINNVWNEIAPAMPDPRDGVVKGYGLQLGIVVFVVGGSDDKGNYVAQMDQYALRC